MKNNSLEQTITETISNLSSEIASVSNENSSTKQVSRSNEFERGIVTISFYENKPVSFSSVSEDYEIEIYVELDDSAHITSAKNVLYNIGDKIQPEREISVTQDYPNEYVRYTEEMSSEEVRNLIQL